MASAIQGQNGLPSWLLRILQRQSTERAFHPEDGVGQLPLRGELFSLDHLRSHAIALANSMSIGPSRTSSREFHDRVDENARIL